MARNFQNDFSDIFDRLSYEFAKESGMNPLVVDLWVQGRNVEREKWRERENQGLGK